MSVESEVFNEIINYRLDLNYISLVSTGKGY